MCILAFLIRVHIRCISCAVDRIFGWSRANLAKLSSQSEAGRGVEGGSASPHHIRLALTHRQCHAGQVSAPCPPPRLLPASERTNQSAFRTLAQAILATSLEWKFAKHRPGDSPCGVRAADCAQGMNPWWIPPHALVPILAAHVLPTPSSRSWFPTCVVAAQD